MAFLKHLWKRFNEDDYFGIPAQLAYFFLLSLFPLLIVIVSLFPYLPITQEDLLGTVRDFAPVGAIEIIEKNLIEISKKNNTLLSLGIIGTLWSASNGINAIVKVINRSYNVEEDRTFFRKRIMAILLTLAMIAVIIVALILPVFGKHIGIVLFSQLELSSEFLTIWNTLRLIVSSVIIFAVLIALYWLAPSKRFSCRTAIPGAIFATIGWIITSYAFSFYVERFANYTVTYGSIGAIIVLMIWFYISGFIMIIGGDVNAYFTVHKKKDC
ncbi:YihY/virulence factor BrkB family protein [Niallia sp. Krafla_26]|uniref:YihY/virulence factor BrkB family protein n=1 Tax=Niallia sp. Krafla_26 TaxID=3064703 RepID=UPI003D168601